MSSRETYLITRSEVKKALTMADAVAAVEAAFRAYGDGKVQMPPKVYLGFEKGDLRSMPAYLPELGLAGVKNVNVHSANTDLPTVMATMTLFDPETGFPLAVLDGTYLTAVRTGAAGGIAAKYLAREDSTVAAFVGAGRQAETFCSCLRPAQALICTAAMLNGEKVSATLLKSFGIITNKKAIFRSVNIEEHKGLGVPEC